MCHGRDIREAKLSSLDLRQYSDPDRAIGSDVVDQQRAAAGADGESSLPEVVVVAPDKPRPAPPVKQHTITTAQRRQQQNPQRPPEQLSTRTTLRNAFRALLWPIRAHPAKVDHVFPEEAGEEAMSQFVTTGMSTKTSPYYYSHEGLPAEQAPSSPGPYSPSPGPLTMQYYHVDSAENEIYQQWVNLLGPSMGGAWMTVNQQPGHGHVLAHRPAVPELLGQPILAELPSDSVQPVELPGRSVSPDSQ